MRIRINLNHNWEFTPRFDEAFARFGSGTEIVRVELPHSCAVTPYNYFDEGIYQMVCGYRRRIKVPESWQGKRVFLTVGAAAHRAELFVNGRRLAEHRCGYTAFRTELTEALSPGAAAELVLRVDSRETLDQPPFGLVVDYMTYGGLYREVYLEICEQNAIEDVFACPEPNGNGGTVSGTVTLTGPASEGEGEFRLFYRLLNAADETVAEHSAPIRQGAQQSFSFEAPDVEPWDIDSPQLYTLQTVLFEGKTPIDRVDTRIGFRRAEWTADGFSLNGRRIKLLGLNRHQSYPYVGYAMPRSMQRLDADILKKELGLNAVRTSHYPQSQHFIDRCDELGLLVFTEIPGWQHIGGEEWKNEAVEAAREMVLQYRNHPSIVLWGVRINESGDDDEFYARTNAAVRELDPTRATAGVRCHKKSSLLEDVYTYNDFSHDGQAPGCEPKRAVTSDMGKAYVITEYCGHMFPTKSFDSEAHRTEHALRHAAVLDAAAGQENIAGSFGWCMFDYNTHKDFGSGDRICYHGVLDMFRNPKLAAAVYSVHQDREPVLRLTSSMDLGERPASNRGRVFALTNCDEVRMYKNDRFVRSYTHADSPYRHLSRPPIEIDDFIGDQLEREENFKPRQAKLVKELLNYSARFGFAHLPPRIMAKAGELMTRYRMTFSDAYALYGKYIGDWGERATEFRFDALKNGEVVRTVRLGAVKSLHLTARPSHTVLREGETYDTVLVRLAMTDQNGNAVPFWHGDVDVDIAGPLECVGPARPTLRGGLGGLYLRTLGEAGEAIVCLQTEQTEPVELRFIIKKQ